MPVSRRKFFFLTGASAVGTMLATTSLKKLYAQTPLAQNTKIEGFGSLQPDPNGILDLPPGFQYRAFSRTGDRMNDGNLVPTNHDGMASFDIGDRRIALVRNHELLPDQPFEGNPQPKYDPGATGGTVTLIVDANNRQLIEHFASLSGTIRNCAGGPIYKNASSQKGSWLSCEETTIVPASDNNLQKRHGFVFEVPANAKKVVDPIPLKDMGRFAHEAVAEDAETGMIYETEDHETGLFYRFTPNSIGNLTKGGLLEALRIKEMPQVNTSNNEQPTIPLNEPMAVDWVPIKSPNPSGKETPTQVQGFEQGAAQFRRGEGCWYGKDENGNPQIIFTTTTGGPNSKGQIWRYSPQAETIELLAEPNDESILENPDNITVGPNGELFVCEDGPGTDRLIGITPDGNFFEFARNAVNDQEMAGVNFSPDGKTLFLNSPFSNPGMTLAIWGPFAKLNRNQL